MPLSIDIRGFPELAKKLHDLGNALSEDVLEAAVRAGAKIARDAAAAKAPRDPTSGDHMGDHIVVRTIEKDGVHAVAGVAPVRWTPEKGNDEGKYFYWRFLEYGTSGHVPTEARPTSGGGTKRVKIIGAGKVGAIRAQPFMRPAVDENEDAITKAIADRLRKEIEKVVAQ